MTELEVQATPEVLPLLPVRDMVMYPSVILPLFVGRDMSINAVEKSLSKDRLILVTAQKDLTDEEIIRMAKYVNADKFIQKLPQGYNEQVMERGATLSTGQRQLIAFARVLAYNPSIFILDEATSNIDTETELLIQDALNKVIENRTSIIIAHRLSTIQNVDRILVLHKGEIVEEGSHFELLDKHGLYYDLYRLQYT